MLDPSLETALNEQLHRELESEYLYLSIAGAMEHAGFPGFARWMRGQAAEEHGHAMRFFDFICDRGGRVRLGALAEPPSEFGQPLAAFERALEHERSITAAIVDLYERADRPTRAFLDWFLTEQVEEEKSVGQIVDALRLAGDSGPALLLLDRELGARSPVEGADEG
ncbi:MAG: ferritin [Actinomycetota bacterium]|nr:MAG: ferritin [Actinomycetota bacterium]